MKNTFALSDLNRNGIIINLLLNKTYLSLSVIIEGLSGWYLLSLTYQR